MSVMSGFPPFLNSCVLNFNVCHNNVKCPRCGLAFNLSRRVLTAVGGGTKQIAGSFFPPVSIRHFAPLCIFKTIQAGCKECHSVVMCERLNKLLCGAMS